MSFPRPDFSPEVIAAAKKDAVDRWPNESCGLIANGVYIACQNTSPTPTEDFRIPSDVVALTENIQAVIHSHPKNNPVPSSADIQSQMDMGCIFGVVPCVEGEAYSPVFWGDFLLDDPLIGRRFIHGISDCYTVVRAWYWQERGIKLFDLPRDDLWWKNDQNLYVNNFLRLGFEQISREDAKYGDCFIGKVRSDVPNHGGVIIENGLGLHHLEGRLSRREPINRWDKFITHYLRYKDA